MRCTKTHVQKNFVTFSLFTKSFLLLSANLCLIWQNYVFLQEKMSDILVFIFLLFSSLGIPMVMYFHDLQQMHVKTTDLHNKKNYVMNNYKSSLHIRRLIWFKWLKASHLYNLSNVIMYHELFTMVPNESVHRLVHQEPLEITPGT